MFCCFRRSSKDYHGATGLKQSPEVATARSPQQSNHLPSTTPNSAPALANNFLEASTQLQKLFSQSTTSPHVFDLWTTLQRAADVMSKAVPSSCHISISIPTASKRNVKVVHSSSMPNPRPMRSQWDLNPISDFPSVLEVALSLKTDHVQAPSRRNSSTSLDSLKRPNLRSDYEHLHAMAQCTSFTHIPLVCSTVLHGTLLIASQPTDHRWIAALWPILAMFLAESNAVQLCTMLEMIQSTTSVRSLAWTITSEISTWLDWCHPDDTEARLVLLNEDKPTALVLYRSVNKTPSPGSNLLAQALSPSSSLMRDKASPQGGGGSGSRRNDAPHKDEDSSSAATAAAWPHPSHAPRHDSMQHSQHSAGASAGANVVANVVAGLMLAGNSGISSDSEYSKRLLLDGGSQLGAPQEGLQGTKVSLTNTLTRRCIMDGSKLLFVSDVMSALRMYGEPWNDVFLDQAVVSNPTWAMAGPIKLRGKPAAALILLSHTRLNSSMLAKATKTIMVPLLGALSHQLQHIMDRHKLGSTSSAGGYMSIPSFSLSDDTNNPYQHFLHAGAASMNQSSSCATSLAGAGSMQRPPPLELAAAAAAAAAALEDEHGSALSTPSQAESRPVRCTVSRTECASTPALVRAYQSAIVQHQRSCSCSGAEELGQVEAIEVIAKVGQGACGSVFAAMWKGLMVAVKVMKQAEGRRAMRMAWEMAVIQSLQHPNIIRVHAVLMDATVDKIGARTMCFHSFLPVHSLTHASDEELQPPVEKPGPRCQVILMEYCSLGPLHNYIAEKRFLSMGRHRAVDSMKRPEDPGAKGLPRIQRSRSCFGDGMPGHRDGVVPNLPLVLSVLLQVASAMQYLHKGGIIHLDLKPENILLKAAEGDIGFVAKVSDFGMSELLTSCGPLIGEMGGTVTHMAPEIITHRMVTKACDVYSFGIIMYELYTCQRPYANLLKINQDRKARDKAILTQVTEEGRRPVFPESSHPQYVALAQRCWSTEPSLRPSFTDVLHELELLKAEGVAGTGSEPPGSSMAALAMHSGSSEQAQARRSAHRGGSGGALPLQQPPPGAARLQLRCTLETDKRSSDGSWLPEHLAEKSSISQTEGRGSAGRTASQAPGPVA